MRTLNLIKLFERDKWETWHGGAIKRNEELTPFKFQRNLAQTWGNRGCHRRDAYLIHPCGLCSQHTTASPFPAAGGHVLPPASSHLPSRRPPPWQRSLTTERECVTLRAILFAPSACRGEHGGFSKGGQRCVNSKQRHILLCAATDGTFSGSALWLCPLNEPSFGRQVFDEGNFSLSTFFQSKSAGPYILTCRLAS